MFVVSRAGGRVLAAMLAVLLLGSWLVSAESGPARADTAPPDSSPTTVAADALPTVQINGVVWSQAIVGNTVYAGGSFANARPAGAAPGTNTTTRNNLLAYDITTGVMSTLFVPNLNGQVLSVTASPDGSRIYVGGDFTTANGVNRFRLAAYSTATGALITTFAPTLNARARAVVATNTTVYVGGSFSTANGVSRTRLAAFSATDGSLLSWAPPADAVVYAMVMAPGGTKLIVGGQFANLNNSSAYGMGALDAVSGANLPWAADAVVQDGGVNAAIDTLSTDGTNVYGAGYVFGSGGNLEGTFAANPANGNLIWIEDCHGDTYSTYSSGAAIYIVGHPHFCDDVPGGFPQTNPWTFHRSVAFSTAVAGTLLHNTQGGYADFGGQPAPKQLDWYPTITAGTFTGQNQGAWHVTGNGQYVVEGGEFPTVNGVGQQGLVRFAVSSLAPNKQGPVVTGANFVPSLVSLSNGTARVAFQANWDEDNTALTYKVVRDGNTASPAYVTTVNSTFFNRPELGFVDSGLAPGSTHTYRLQVNDPFGNTVLGDSRSVTISSTSPSAYAQRVIADAAKTYWRLGEAAGNTAYDWSGFADGIVGTGVTRGATGAILGDSNTASTFNGTPSGSVIYPTNQPGPNSFSIEAWIKTTSTTGGKIVGFGDRNTGDSASYDRHLYMDNGGHVIFGVYPGHTVTLNSATSYNDGKWHHIVATMGSGGMALYVDATRVGTNTSVTTAQAYTGYWRVGGDNLNGWPNRPSNEDFTGSIDDVAFYPAPLTATQVNNHYTTGTVVGSNVLPTAAFTSSASNLVASFDGSGSTDSDGTIASYAWMFGDGATGTGVSPNHTYASANTYTVSLTVTDNAGGTNTVSHPITVSASNVLPTAAFTSSATNLVASFDGSGSTDSDGTIASYAWTFGDGGTGTGVSPSHTYASANTYTVSLTVTDNSGGTNTVSHPITVTSGGGPTQLAADAFGRVVANGFGTADLGGPWSLSGSASNFSVASGVGKIAMPTAGSSSVAFLGNVSSSDTQVQVGVAVDKAQTGGGTYVSVIGRRISSNTDYRVKLHFVAGGSVAETLEKVVGGTETSLSTLTVSGLTYSPGAVLEVKLQVTGTSPTTLSSRVWLQGTTEPTTWQATTTDSTAGLQVAGAVALLVYLSSSSTSLPTTASFSAFSAQTTH